jgi:hypothetical protein
MEMFICKYWEFVDHKEIEMFRGSLGLVVELK